MRLPEAHFIRALSGIVTVQSLASFPRTLLFVFCHWSMAVLTTTAESRAVAGIDGGATCSGTAQQSVSTLSVCSQASPFRTSKHRGNGGWGPHRYDASDGLVRRQCRLAYPQVKPELSQAMYGTHLRVCTLSWIHLCPGSAHPGVQPQSHPQGPCM